MKAMILTAGKGTRLGKLTGKIPKAMIDINGKSVLQLAVEKCHFSGFDDIIINVHHFADRVEKEVERLNRIGFRISVSNERDMLLETGGGLFKAKDFFDNKPFLLYNADIISNIDLKSLYNFHITNSGIATLAVRNRPGNRFFLIDEHGILKGWCNKSTGERIIAGEENEELFEIAFSGMHIIDPEIFNFMTEGVYTMTALYLQLASLHRIGTYRYDDGYWFDIGTPEKLNEVREFFL
ncbi:MAG: sugar phosphate nucleotidyltransferase [Bacteroidales bacterium]|jgi:NDP-sugar pyrophosphorylase family protein|nr:sugar phosphate nucleotidyltransferase [Bacteroidales bacterium]